MLDASRGYERIAPLYIAQRGRSARGVGSALVEAWTRTLTKGATVLDLGCGTGLPGTHALLEQGLNVYAIDAAPSMVAAFKTRFPDVPVECAPVEESHFFHRHFDAVLAWGLLFLLDEATQRALIAKVARALVDGGAFLFTAPAQAVTWHDAMTNEVSISLGYDAYRDALNAVGLELTHTECDEGGNHFYLARKR